MYPNTGTVLATRKYQLPIILHMRRAPTADDRPPAATVDTDPATVTLNLSLGHVGATLSDDEELQGVVVSHVHPNDLAARSGLRPGDVIVALNDEPVRSHKVAVTTINNMAGSGLLNITYLPSDAAAAEREQSRKDKGDKQPKHRFRLSVENVLLVVFCLLWLNSIRSNMGGGATATAGQQLTPAQEAKLEALEKSHRHEAKDKLVEELQKVSDRALHFIARNHTGEELELHQPLLLSQMLRTTMILDHLLNVTAGLGLEGGPEGAENYTTMEIVAAMRGTPLEEVRKHHQEAERKQAHAAAAAAAA